jgi:hypothetical protein
VRRPPSAAGAREWRDYRPKAWLVRAPADRKGRPGKRADGRSEIFRNYTGAGLRTRERSFKIENGLDGGYIGEESSTVGERKKPSRSCMRRV